ncbi:MAG: hypothetical protein EAZ77_00980 [Nostocales cyanobacterium]|nr:MAG: hypothetical protein EAZ77_00980 [Nostocales cyanobacterium]
MINLKLLPALTGLTLATIFTTSTAVQAQNFDKPSANLKVERKSGTCPTTVGLWWMVFGIEGGADHIVVADTRFIANNAKVIKSNDKFVEYEAALEAKYASCVGQANLYMYSFQFRHKKLYFSVNLQGRDGYFKIVNKQLVGFRPYVFWQAAE